ncbi:MAG: hypothetical protein JXN61_10860, partial [Sedimentisphaerales bacterium]|nr:hypothetical protein [Sedimentisphaerales bacterium]
ARTTGTATHVKSALMVNVRPVVPAVAAPAESVAATLINTVVMEPVVLMTNGVASQTIFAMMSVLIQSQRVIVMLIMVTITHALDVQEESLDLTVWMSRSENIREI